MKKRVAWLVIDGKQFGGYNTNVDLSFDVQYTGTNLVPNNSTFSISNLNSHDMYEIVTNTARFVERKRKIECWAGYEDNVKQIFAGQILQANPVNIPDTTISISALANINDLGKYVSVNIKKPRYIDLLKDAARACNLTPNIPVEIEKSELLQTVVGNTFEFNGSAYNYLQYIETAMATLNSESKKALAFPIQNNILWVYWQGEQYPITPKVISAESGLIGIPTPTEAGISFQTIMDISLQPLQTIYLESKRLKLFTGVKNPYNIMNIRHHGSLRGKDWYSDLDCVKV